jgi:hypothetical protein
MRLAGESVTAMTDWTRLLEAAHRGDKQAAADLLPLVYDELRRLAAVRLAQEKPGQTLSATAIRHIDRRLVAKRENREREMVSLRLSNEEMKRDHFPPDTFSL